MSKMKGYVLLRADIAPSEYLRCKKLAFKTFHRCYGNRNAAMAVETGFKDGNSFFLPKLNKKQIILSPLWFCIALVKKPAC